MRLNIFIVFLPVMLLSSCLCKCDKMCFSAGAIFFVLASSLVNARQIDSSYQIKVGFLFSDFNYPLHYRHFKPACDFALKTINDLAHEGIYLNISISYVWSTTDKFCGYPIMKAPGIVAQLYYEHNIMALFGPPCSSETSGVADLAAYWNIPVLSGVSTSKALDQKNRFRTLTRTSFNFSTLYNFFLSLFEKNKWETAAIVVDQTTLLPRFWPFVADGLKDVFTDNGVEVNYVPLVNYQKINDALVDTIKRGRSKLIKC